MADSSLFAVKADGVGYSYGRKRVLDNISFELEEGKMFCILGPNGSGKTTLFKIISTIFALQDGEISVAGRSLRQFPTPVRRKLGVLFQNPAVDMKLTVRENLRHHGNLYGLDAHDLENRINKNLEALGVEDRGGEMVESLSGGLRRRVEIAKVLLTRPSILLMDEPTTGLDPAIRSELWSILSGIRNSRKLSVLFTTHLLEEAEPADEILLLDQGRSVASGKVAELRSGLGKEYVRLGTYQPKKLAARIRKEGEIEVTAEPASVKVVPIRGLAAPLAIKLWREYNKEVTSVTLCRPTLEDLFLQKTGRHWSSTPGEI
jgi:ABC-2 type transport system ATP-binding protein